MLNMGKHIMAYIGAYPGDAFELQTKCFLAALAQTTSHLHAMFMHHVVAYDSVLIVDTVPSR